jgi:predicted Zn-dependent peptidase
MTVEEITARIDAVTIKDISRVADTLLRSEKLNLAVVGPLNKQEDRFLGLLHF